VLFTEDTIVALSVDSFNFEEIIGPSRALYMERDHAPAMLALDAGATVPFTTDYALEVEPLRVNFTHSDGSLGSHGGPWDPHGA